MMRYKSVIPAPSVPGIAIKLRVLMVSRCSDSVTLANEVKARVWDSLSWIPAYAGMTPWGCIFQTLTCLCLGPAYSITWYSGLIILMLLRSPGEIQTLLESSTSMVSICPLDSATTFLMSSKGKIMNQVHSVFLFIQGMDVLTVALCLPTVDSPVCGSIM